MMKNFLADIWKISRFLPRIPALDRGWNEMAMGDEENGLEMEIFVAIPYSLGRKRAFMVDEPSVLVFHSTADEKGMFWKCMSIEERLDWA